MLRNDVKKQISELVQELLQQVDDHEMPDSGEISFLLHIDGARSHSWANIRNMSEAHIPAPGNLCKNMRLSNRRD